MLQTFSETKRLYWRIANYFHVLQSCFFLHFPSDLKFLWSTYTVPLVPPSKTQKNPPTQAASSIISAVSISVVTVVMYSQEEPKILEY